MDKNSIKKYAIFARRELIERVSTRAQRYGITEDGTNDPNAVTRADGEVMNEVEKKQRQALIRRIESIGWQQAMEEAAYTWFNRFCALRFMEVNGYLPSKIRVFTDENNAFKPQILAEALQLGDKFDDIDMAYVIELKEANETGTLYKYLLITQCNALKTQLPGLFTKLDDYTELLIPDHLLREGSAIEQMIAMIPEDDWKDEVQIIGWLYQYYNTEPKDEVFANLKKNIKIDKDHIPAATQLFTPDWIVRYMVENSLGRLAVDMNPNLRNGVARYAAPSAGDTAPSAGTWRYYLDEAEQEPDVEAQLAEIRKQYAGMKPEDIKCIDPCMGSGHILVYMFDVLVQIYEAAGYNAREAASLIVENNLYGLDIDDRAAQLAYFAVMMKARQYDRRFLTRDIQPHVYAIAESNGVNAFVVKYFLNGREDLRPALETIITELTDAKEYGSILKVTPQNWAALYARFDEVAAENKFDVSELRPLIEVAEVLASQYDVVVTNPPYMGGSGMGAKLSEFVKKNYPDSKSDMSTVMMERSLMMCSDYGYMSMINIPVWMFLSSFEKLRESIIKTNTITSMVHPGRGIFGSDFGTTSFVICKKYIENYKGHYRRLFDKQGEVETIEQREERFFEKRGVFFANQSNFSKIPGSPVAYWVGEAVYKAFENETLADVAKPRQGLATADNDRFLRFWNEVDFNRIGFGFESRDAAKQSQCKWFPMTKGGDYRKWYGNNEYLVNWENDGYEIIHNVDENGKQKSRPQNLNFYFKEGFTWSAITASFISMRYCPKGYIFNAKGSMCFPNQTKNIYYLLGLMNSYTNNLMLSFLAPTLDYSEGPVGKTPVIISSAAKPRVDALVEENIALSRADWDAFETSWDFEKHPLL